MGRVRVGALSVGILLLVVALAACNSSPATGSLKVTLSGLPSGVNGAVSVTGPGGYATTVTTTTTLAGLTPGTYAVAAAPALNGNAIVPTAYDGSVSAATVSVQQNATASTSVSYATRPGSGHLWVPVWPVGPGQAVSYASSSLATSGSPAVDVTLTSATDAGEALAFDGAGNLWVSDYKGYIYQYGVAQLDGSGTTTPAVTIDATAYGSIGGLAFDAAGNLWVAGFGSSKLLAYSPAQLAAGGAVTPTAVISATSTPSLSKPTGLAFDASGDLWVSNSGTGVSTVVAFAPTQLATGSPTPTVTISPNGTPSLSRPGGLAFDAAGNLWVANLTSTTVVRFDAAQLAAPGGSPTPAATIASGSFASSGGPWGLAIDASGALWVAESYAADLRRFSNPDSLTGTVAPAPDTVISALPEPDLIEIAFSPAPANLPIQAP